MEQNTNKLEIAYIVSVIIIFILATSYIIINNKKKNILENWEEYRCKPYIIPFASMFGVSTYSNYRSCSWSIIKAFFTKLLKPIIYVFELIFKNIKNMSKTLDFMRKYIFSVRKFIMSYISDLMNRLESFTATLRFTLIKVNTMIQKNKAVVNIVKYMAEVLGYMLMWIKNIVRPIILSIILWGIAMSYILWFIFPPFSYIMGTLAAGAGLVYSCFSPDSLITLGNNERIPIKNITFNSVLKNGSIVKGIIKTIPDHNNLFDLNGTIVSGDHPILLNDKWTRVKEHHLSKKINNSNIQELYCLITSDNRIIMGDDEYTDYIETPMTSILTKELILSRLNNQNTELISPNEDISLFGFLSNTPIKLNDGNYKQLSDIKIGDKLHNNDKVLSIISFKLTPDIQLYLYDNEIIVSGGQIVYEDNKWCCVYESSKIQLMAENCLPLLLYHINTSSGEVLIGDYKFRDFIETKDSVVNEIIGNTNIEYLNK